MGRDVAWTNFAWFSWEKAWKLGQKSLNWHEIRLSNITLYQTSLACGSCNIASGSCNIVWDSHQYPEEFLWYSEPCPIWFIEHEHWAMQEGCHCPSASANFALSALYAYVWAAFPCPPTFVVVYIIWEIPASLNLLPMIDKHSIVCGCLMTLFCCSWHPPQNSNLSAWRWGGFFQSVNVPLVFVIWIQYHMFIDQSWMRHWCKAESNTRVENKENTAWCNSKRVSTRTQCQVWLTI